MICMEEVMLGNIPKLRNEDSVCPRSVSSPWDAAFQYLINNGLRLLSI